MVLLLKLSFTLKCKLSAIGLDGKIEKRRVLGKNLPPTGQKVKVHHIF